MKRLTALLLAAALALSLAACGPEGKAADTVRYGLSNAWDALMPYNSPSGSNYSRIIYDKIYDRLAYVHADGTLEPRAASSWESADGGTAALFHLDEKAAFHDGTPVTAEHWTDTIALLTDPGGRPLRCSPAPTTPARRCRGRPWERRRWTSTP